MSAFSERVCHLSHSRGAADGGITTAVADLQAAQAAHGLGVRWLAADTHPARRRDRLLLAELRASLAPVEVLHVHGLWRSPTRAVAALAGAAPGRSTPPLVIAPHGMLDPWALRRSRWKKRLVWGVWERRALAGAGALQALCAAEAEAIAALGLGRPIALIPNGVVLPPEQPAPLPPPPWADRIPAGEPVLLFLSRFHAKKGLEPLLAAWQRLQPELRRHGWWLALVGYGDDGALAARVAASGPDRCVVAGPCFGAEKLACLEAASAFVLPSFSEGLPMAALEAMAHRLPCLLTPGCHLPEALAAGAALAVEPTEASLVAGLQELLALPEQQRQAMGAAGRALVEARFSWPRVAADTAALYRWLNGDGPAPTCVQQTDGRA